MFLGDAAVTFLGPMKRYSLATALLACLFAALLLGAQTGSAKPPAKAPREFFGIGPQTTVTDRDAAYMKAGGIETMRVPVVWAWIQRHEDSEYDWSGLDGAVERAARRGIRVLPFIYGTPGWLAAKQTTLPIYGRARDAWRALLRAAVQRYGPGGDFWIEHSPAVAAPSEAIRRPLPIRAWQIWNEANFFYFALPASPQRYAKLVQISSPAIKSVDRGAKVLLSGLFGRPTARGARGMPADRFLKVLYRVPGIKSRFDGIALHPYAINVRGLATMAEDLREVADANRDPVPLYVTEMGWGSEDNFDEVAFEQGIGGQRRQLQAAYSYLLANRATLRLRSVYWFSWKDVTESACSFCDSVGLFRSGEGFRPKPAWHAFVKITGGRARP